MEIAVRDVISSYFWGTWEALPGENGIHNQQVGHYNFHYNFPLVTVVDCPAEIHCIANFTLQNGTFSRLMGEQHQNRISFILDSHGDLQCNKGL